MTTPNSMAATPRRLRTAAPIRWARHAGMWLSLDNARALHFCYRRAEAAAPAWLQHETAVQVHRAGYQRQAARRVGRVAGKRQGGVRKVDGAFDWRGRGRQQRDADPTVAAAVEQDAAQCRECGVAGGGIDGAQDGERPDVQRAGAEEHDIDPGDG